MRIGNLEITWGPPKPEYTEEQLLAIINNTWRHKTAYWAPECMRDEEMLDDLREEIAFSIYCKIAENQD